MTKEETANLSPLRLLTLEEAKAYLKIPPDDRSQDDSIRRAIEEASAQIQSLLLASDESTLSPQTRTATFQTEDGQTPPMIFLRPLPGSPYDPCRQEKSAPVWKTIDLGTLEYVTDQVVDFLQKVRDPAYIAKLQGNVSCWLDKCRLQAPSDPAELCREYVHILGPAASPHQLARNWGLELRLCFDDHCVHGTLEGILYYPNDGPSQTRIDMRFPAKSIALRRTTLPRRARALLRSHAVPTIWLDARRQREDILVELIVQVLGYISAESDQAARFFPVFQSYVINRLWRHRTRLSSEDRDAVIFEVFHHVCRNYGPVSSGKVWWRYLKLVLNGKICDSLRREEVRWDSPKNTSKAYCGLDFNFAVIPSPSEKEVMLVRDAAKLLRISPSSWYKEIRKGIIQFEHVLGQTMLKSEHVQQLLKSIQAKDKNREDAKLLAEDRRIGLKSAMRRLQREKRNSVEKIADAEDTSDAGS